MIEIYVVFKLMIDNWCWVGVFFYLCIGKVFGYKCIEVVIKFKQVLLLMFLGMLIDCLLQNFLIIGILLIEIIELQFNVKVFGLSVDIDGVEMKFCYGDYFCVDFFIGYEMLIYDCMIGDNILFQCVDGVEVGWVVVQLFMDVWVSVGSNGIEIYEVGSDGFKCVDELFRCDG